VIVIFSNADLNNNLTKGNIYFTFLRKLNIKILSLEIVALILLFRIIKFYMKKIIYFIVAVLAVMNANAQFSFNNKTITVSGWGSDTEPKDAQCVMTNNSTADVDSMISWSIVTFDIPYVVKDTLLPGNTETIKDTIAWQFDFCDPYDCIVNLSLGSSNTFKLKKGLSGPLKGQFYTKGNPGTATVRVRLAYANGSHDADTITLIAKGWATGLSNVKKQSEVSFFPNPAKDLITLKYQTTKAIDVTVYNVLGAKVKSFTHSTNETSLNISDLEKGMYFIRFNDNGNIVSKSFTKSE
jgi:hypothetical protein